MPNTPNQTPTTPKNTNYAKKTPTMPKKHQIRKKHQICKKNTKYSKNFHLRCFVAKKILFQIYALCWCTFYRPKNYGGVPKWTNIRYVLSLILGLQNLCRACKCVWFRVEMWPVLVISNAVTVVFRWEISVRKWAYLLVL